MKIVPILLPGFYEDLWIYKGHVLLWTSDKQLLFTKVDDLVGAIKSSTPGTGILPEILFARNEWKASNIFEGMLGDQGIRSAFDRLFVEFPNKPIQLNVDQLFSSVDIEPHDGSLLDVDIYSDRAYLSTTQGFYDVDLEWAEYEPIPLGGLRQRLGRRCVSASTGYGLVNASCEDAGLFTGFNELSHHRNERSPLLRTDDRSIRTSWASRALINYRGDDGPSLIPGVIQSSPRSSQPTSLAAATPASGTQRGAVSIITSYSDQRYRIQRIVTEALHGSLARGRGPSIQATRQLLGYESHESSMHQAPDFRLVANVGNRLFIESGSRIGLVNIKTKDGVPRVGGVQALPEGAGRIVSVTRIRSGLVIETESAVDLWTKNHSSRLYQGEAVRVRTFPDSRRYYDLVAIVLDDAAMIIGVYDDQAWRSRD